MDIWHRTLRRLHVHWHKRIFSAGIYGYEECRCGDRQAVVIRAPGYSYLDSQWLGGGDQSFKSPVLPPKEGSGSVR